MKTICHRINLYNQNNIYLIEDSIKNGDNNFEVDIQLCSDGLVVYHDDTLEKIGIHKHIKNFTINQLEKYNIHSINRLFAILDKIESNISVFLDLKGSNEKLIGALYKILLEFNNRKVMLYIQSFNHFFIDLLKDILVKKRNIVYGYLINGFMNIQWNTYLKKIDFVCIDNTFVNKYVDKIDKNIYIYNCNNPDDIIVDQKYIKGVITDFPRKFKLY